MGSICALKPEDVTDDYLGSARHLHYGSFFLHTQLRAHVPALFRRARALGVSLSLDTTWDPADRWDAPLPETLPLTDVMMPNDQEALRISRCANLEQAAAWFQSQGVRIVTLKKGAAGAEVYAGKEHRQLTTTPVTGGDSVGAGDSFDAGFLTGWLRSLPLEQCLRIGCICGRSVASKIGGVEGQPSWDAVTQALKQASL